MKVALTIAGFDSSGGAGVAADLKTFAAHEVWGAAAVTAVTAQNNRGVHAVETVDPAVVRRQIDSVVTGPGVDAAKTGMLANSAIVEAVAASLTHLDRPLVVDPVMHASAGGSLLDEDALVLIVERLLPLATVVTPNLAEAAALTGLAVRDRAGMEAAGQALVEAGVAVAIITGGHLEGDAAADCVVARAGPLHWLESPRLDNPATHGSGCVLSAAVTAELAKGMDPVDACIAGKHFVEGAIAAGLHGAVNPLWRAT